MDSEDEDEIQKQAEALKKMVVQSAPDAPATVEAVVQKIIAQTGLHFEDDIMKKRFEKLVESRLREIRSSLEVADMLKRQKKIGGLELPEQQVNVIVRSLDAEANYFHKKKTEKPAAVPPATPQPVSMTSEQHRTEYPQAPPAFVPRPGGAAPSSPPLDEKPEELAQQIQRELAAMKPPTAPPSPEPAQKIEVETVAPPPKKMVIEPKPPAADHELYGQPAEEMPRITPRQSDRAAMVDIRQPSNVVGPVEEIRQIDLKEFRRMGNNPEESAEAISEKIDLLEEESWQMRMDGVNAWRQSPLYALYLEIGQGSIEADMGVADAINTRKEKNQPYLLMEEFLAINKLNGSITV